MAMKRALGLVALAALAVGIPAASAVPFTSDLPFADVATATSLSVLSGALRVDAQAGGAPAVLANVTTFEIEGLALACWQYPCVRSAGDLTVRVATGSTVALRFPTTGSLHLAADHAVAAPLALDATKAGFGELAAGLTLAPSLAAATRNGVLTFEPEALAAQPDGPIPVPAPSSPLPVPLPSAVASQFQAPDPDDSNSAVLAGLTDVSVIEVVEAGRVLQTLRGYSGLLLQGTLRTTAVHAESFLLPCGVRCDLVVAANGPGADVLGAVQGLLDLAGTLDGVQTPLLALGPFESLVDPVADGALLEIPLVASLADFHVANLTLVRFDRLQAALYPGAPPVGGSGDLVIQSGDVQGDDALSGARFLGVPVWAYILWAAALIALVLRAALRRNEEASERKGLARLVGLLALVGAAVLWHLAFTRILGVGATSAGLDGAARLMVGAVEASTFLLVLVLVALPGRVLLRNALRLVGLPRVSRFAGTAALAATAVIGPLLLLGIIDVVLALFA